MSHYVHEVVVNFVSLLFSAGQVVYTFLQEKLQAAARNKVDESGESEQKY